MSRPKSVNPVREWPVVRFHLAPDDRDHLDALAAAAGESREETLRRLVRAELPSLPPTDIGHGRQAYYELDPRSGAVLAVIALPDGHRVFAPTMEEARRMIGEGWERPDVTRSTT